MRGAAVGAGGAVAAVVMVLASASGCAGESGEQPGEHASDGAGTTAPAESRASAFGDQEVIAFLDHDVTEAERRAIEAELEAQPDLVDVEYRTQDEALAEARRLFRDNPEMLARFEDDPGLVPALYSVTLGTADTDVSAQLVGALEDLPGVLAADAAPAWDSSWPTPEPPTAADRGGDVLVFLDDDLTDAERQAVVAELDARSEVASYEYWDEAASLAEARELFRDDAEMLEKLDNGTTVPTSYRLTLNDIDRVSAGRLALDLEDLPGVLETVVTDQFVERAD
jgi:cell division protein FtsX